jgi:hypothetical protein
LAAEITEDAHRHAADLDGIVLHLAEKRNDGSIVADAPERPNDRGAHLETRVVQVPEQR